MFAVLSIDYYAIFGYLPALVEATGLRLATLKTITSYG